MTCRDILIATIDPTQSERTRRIRIDKPHCKMSCTVHHSYAGAGNEERNSHGRLDEEMGLQEQRKNPLHNKRTPTGLEYLNCYNVETAYLSPRRNIENSKTYKRRLYTVILTSLQAEFGHQQLRVERKRPHIKWLTVWRNMSMAPVSELTKIAWYKVIHGTVPTNKQLHCIKMAPTDNVETVP
jgi:hypothetical protein